jgi:hypothetical protein
MIPAHIFFTQIIPPIPFQSFPIAQYHDTHAKTHNIHQNFVTKIENTRKYGDLENKA